MTWDWLSDLGSTVGTYYSNNKDWINPLVKVGVGALQQSNKDNSQSQYLDYLKEREKQNYQQSVDQINAYNAQLAAAGAGGGGGGGDGGAAAAAAARATEANRRKAAKKANKSSQKTYKEMLAIYAPYRQTADVLLPQMTQTYQNSLGMQKSLADYLKSPAQMAKLDASIPAYNINIPLPDEVRLK